jgi:NADPH:quinone reductase-like Zn-dependent oxidoreductase
VVLDFRRAKPQASPKEALQIAAATSGRTVLISGGGSGIGRAVAASG